MNPNHLRAVPPPSEPPEPGLTASLAWGAEGVRVDLVDDEGERTHEWILSWAEVASLVGEGCESPVAVANCQGVRFMGVHPSEGLLGVTLRWDELAGCAKVRGTPVEGCLQ